MRKKVQKSDDEPIIIDAYIKHPPDGVLEFPLPELPLIVTDVDLLKRSGPDCFSKSMTSMMS